MTEFFTNLMNPYYSLYNKVNFRLEKFNERISNSGTHR